MRRQLQSGFTLFEGLLTLAIFLLVLAMLSSALADFSTFQKRFFRGDGERSAIPELLAEMRDEIWQSSEVSTPSGPVATDRIVLRKIDPDRIRTRSVAGVRPQPTFPNLFWRTNTEPHRTVRFEYNSGAQKIRKLSGSQRVLKGGDITGFQCRRLASGDQQVFEFTLSVQDGEVIKQWKGTAVKDAAW